VTDPAPGKPSRLAEAKGRVVAVIVGGDEYGGTGYARLRFSVNDALSLATALRKTLPPERLALSVLTDNETDPLGRPTRAAVLERVRQAAKEAGCEDTLLFFFAGHGEVRGGRAFLIPEDVDPFAFEQTAIEVDMLLAIVSESAAKTKLFVIDACQTEETGELVEKSGSELRGRGIPKRGIRPMSSGFLKGFEQRLGDAIIFLSCSPGEVAAESPQEHHGAFSYFLARGLRGEADLDADGVVSLAELIQFVTQKVTDWARSRGEGWLHKVDDLHGEIPHTRELYKLRSEYLGALGLKDLIVGSGRRDGRVRLNLPRESIEVQPSLSLFVSLHKKNVLKALEFLSSPKKKEGLKYVLRHLEIESYRLGRNSSMIQKALHYLGWELNDMSWKEAIKRAIERLSPWMELREESARLLRKYYQTT